MDSNALVSRKLASFLVESTSFLVESTELGSSTVPVLKHRHILWRIMYPAHTSGTWQQDRMETINMS